MRAALCYMLLVMVLKERNGIGIWLIFLSCLALEALVFMVAMKLFLNNPKKIYKQYVIVCILH